MVNKSIPICRAHGIMAIDGATYFRDMQQQDSGWHMANPESSLANMATMMEEARNALYGA